MEDIKNYEIAFNAKVYMQNKIEKSNQDLYFSIINNLHKAFSRVDVSGEWLLDVGTGPSLYTSFLASRKFKNIVLSDISESNREELVKWTSGDVESHDWSDTLKYIEQVEANSLKFIEARTRDAIRAIVRIDVLDDDPLGKTWFQRFDCILTSLCLESACRDLESYEKSLKSLTRLLKPNGVFIITGTLNQTFYKVGDTKWPVLSLNLDTILEIFNRNGYIIEFSMSDPLQHYSDLSGSHLVIARLK